MHMNICTEISVALDDVCGFHSQLLTIHPGPLRGFSPWRSDGTITNAGKYQVLGLVPIGREGMYILAVKESTVYHM